MQLTQLWWSVQTFEMITNLLITSANGLVSSNFFCITKRKLIAFIRSNITNPNKLKILEGINRIQSSSSYKCNQTHILNQFSFFSIIVQTTSQWPLVKYFVQIKAKTFLILFFCENYLFWTKRKIWV
jgi:hypothetical protein